MAKFHLRKDGMPGVCRAKTNACPLGSDDEHFETKMDALQAAEEKAREEGNFLLTVKKHVIYHVGQNGAVEECVFREGYCEVKPFDTFDTLHSADYNVIDGVARAFREASAKLPPPNKTRTSKPKVTNEDDTYNVGRYMEEQKERLRQQREEKEQRRRDDAARAREADAIRNDGYDYLREKGWTEDEVRVQRDSCGHPLPPAPFRSQRSYTGC